MAIRNQAPGDVVAAPAASAAGCNVPGQPALNGANDVTVSPDGVSVYVASIGDDSISQFNRAANANLSYVGCFADTSAAGCNVPAQAALAGAKGVAVSPDGGSVYVASSVADSISQFAREPALIPPDTTAPETIKGKGPANTIRTRKKKLKVKFAFSSPEAGATFECILDHKACASPAKVKVKAKRKRRSTTSKSGRSTRPATPTRPRSTSGSSSSAGAELREQELGNPAASGSTSDS